MANIITSIRIFCAAAMLFCPTFSPGFYILYILGGISDVFDGIVARHLGKETMFGAHFDSFADIIFTVTVLIKTIIAIKIPIWIIIWAVCIAAIKCVSFIIGFINYKRFISEHTLLNKICGIFLFFIPLIVWLPRRPVTIFIILTCIIATVAAVQEGHYIYTGKEIG